MKISPKLWRTIILMFLLSVSSLLLVWDSPIEMIAGIAAAILVLWVIGEYIWRIK